jgi:hypothetical protein
MRKTTLITAILLLSAVWAVAQTSPSSSPQSSTPSSASPQSASPSSQAPDTSTTQTTTTQTTETSSDTNSTAIEGCLSGSSGSYTLTDQSGKAWTLAGDTSKLSDHVGHQIRIMGSDNSASSGAGSSAASAGGAGAAGGSTFNVKKVKMISSSCSTSK